MYLNYFFIPYLLPETQFQLKSAFFSSLCLISKDLFNRLGKMKLNNYLGVDNIVPGLLIENAVSGKHFLNTLPNSLLQLL